MLFQSLMMMLSLRFTKRSAQFYTRLRECSSKHKSMKPFTSSCSNFVKKKNVPQIYALTIINLYHTLSFVFLQCLYDQKWLKLTVSHVCITSCVHMYMISKCDLHESKIKSQIQRKTNEKVPVFLPELSNFRNSPFHA